MCLTVGSCIVKIQPNPKCKLPGIDASAEDKEVLKFEYWCENRLMVHLPWLLDHNQLKGDHLDWRSAFEAKLPAWVRQLKKALEIGDAALPEWPLENLDCELPDVLVHEYAHALMERGHITLEAPYDDSDVSDSESEDPAEETDLSYVDSDELEDAGCNFSAGPDDTDDAEDPTNVLDDLISQHDWQASSAAVLKRMACDISPVASRQDASGGRAAQCGDDSAKKNLRFTHDLSTSA
jgi:hypothetical protein